MRARRRLSQIPTVENVACTEGGGGGTDRLVLVKIYPGNASGYDKLRLPNEYRISERGVIHM